MAHAGTTAATIMLLKNLDARAQGHAAAGRVCVAVKDRAHGGEVRWWIADCTNKVRTFVTANTGRKQQTERKDASRIDASLRQGVFDNYAKLGAAKGDTLTAIDNLLKDAWELLTKAEQLAPATSQA
ncbi:MAG: hypothetical protein IT383_28280 [Deltaproteobacteria bacterium]|nr:hypothetical protein [Deltaproteobacteria bacterium]